MSVDYQPFYDIISENLSVLEAESDTLSERRYAQLADLAHLVMLEGKLEGGDSVFENFRNLFKEREVPEDAEDAAALLKGEHLQRLLSDKLSLCGFILDFCDQKVFRSFLTGSEETRTFPKSPKIAYLKNLFADSAFMAFSKAFESPSVIYHEDFQSVCDDVYSGRADMCILPLYNSRDAKLVSFYRLIEKYELKIILSCDISSPGEDMTTRYALLAHCGTFTNPIRIDGDSCTLMELSFVPDRDVPLHSLLQAAVDSGFEVYKVDSLPLTYSDNDFSYNIVLNCEKADIKRFLMFLKLAAPHHEIIGLFPHILVDRIKESKKGRKEGSKRS